MRVLFLIHFCLLYPVFAFSMESIGDSIDCTDVSIDFIDSPDLTREERITLMERAFFESLDKFELCQAAREMASSKASSASGAGSGAGGGGGEGGSGGGSGGIQGTEGSEGTDGEAGALGDMSSGVESVASSSMSGTEAKPIEPAELEIPPSETTADTSYGESTSQAEGSINTDSGGVGMNTANNGATPEDIPPSANDDALAAQIRYAAENETDPQKKAQLWNEYRKYKGLPQK